MGAATSISILSSSKLVDSGILSFLDNKRPEITEFQCIFHWGVTVAYHKPHPQRVRETEKRVIYMRGPPTVKWGESPTDKPPSLAAPAGLVWKLQTELSRLQVGLLPRNCLRSYGKVGRKNNQVWESAWSPASWSSNWEKKKQKEMRRMRRDVGVSQLRQILLYSYCSGGNL